MGLKEIDSVNSPSESLVEDEKDEIDSEFEENTIQCDGNQKLLENLKKLCQSNSDITDFESFLDTELIIDLIHVYLKQNNISQAKFANFVLQTPRTSFNYYILDDSLLWQSRVSKAKIFFHKLNKILSVTPYTTEMKEIECKIYKQRIPTLIKYLEAANYSERDFAKDELEIPLAEFEKIKYDCMQEISLRLESKEHMRKIAEYISLKQFFMRQKRGNFLRTIKGNFFKNCYFHFIKLIYFLLFYLRKAWSSNVI